MEPAVFETVKRIVQEHEEWRNRCLNLIASENVTSQAVSMLLSNDLSHRYGDYEGIDLNSRKYLGNRYIIQLEKLCCDLARRLFGSHHVDLRPLSGHIAGVAPLFALCKAGDTVLELNQECGGHRLTGKLVNCPLVELRALAIPFDVDRFNINVAQTLELIEAQKPRFLILGSSTFLFPHPVAELRRGISELGVETLVQYDGSHVLGLIAGQRFQAPLSEGADLITSSTHKTLGGPQGGIVLTNSDAIAEAVGKSLQPGLLSNHHLHRIPALCQKFSEWLEGEGGDPHQIVQTARALGAALDRRGVPVVASHLGFTSSHTILIQSKPFGPARELAADLERADIIAGACRLPGNLGPDGLRLGTQEIVRRGLRADEVDEIASVIAAVLKRDIDVEGARKRVNALARRIAQRGSPSSNKGVSKND